MSSDAWVERSPTDKEPPAHLKPTDLVEYELVGDGGTYGPEPVSTLFWGAYTGPAEVSGRIVAYRQVATVPIEPARKHNHYFKPVAGLETVDVYRMLELFGVTDQALGHAIKKLLVAGGRGAGKDIRQDVAEAIDTLQRWQEMRAEDAALRRA